MVHGDFLPDNVLVHEGHVTAVIDIAAAGCGNRAIDLARLLVWCYDDLDSVGRRRLLERIRKIGGRPCLAICVAEQVLDLVAYAIGHWSAESVARVVERGWHILGDLHTTS